MMYSLIILFILFPICLFLLHVLTVRLFLILKIKFSNQKMLIYFILFFNIFMLIMLAVIGFDVRKDIYYYLYGFLYFNLVGYSYFHLFNMSETARRIKILVNIKKGKIKNVFDLSVQYDYNSSLLTRLKRLEELSQIEFIDNKYSLRKKILYNAACVVVLFRKILGFKG